MLFRSPESGGIGVGGVCGADGAGVGVDAGGGWCRYGAFWRTGGKGGRWTWGGHVRALAWDGRRGYGGPGAGAVEQRR